MTMVVFNVPNSGVDYWLGGTCKHQKLSDVLSFDVGILTYIPLFTFHKAAIVRSLLP